MATFTVQPDPTAGIDGGVQEASPDSGLGVATSAGVVLTAGSRRNIVIKFDVSSLAGNTVNSAALYLYNLTTLATNQTFELNSILAANSAWVESATWNYAVPSTVRWAGDTGANGGTDAGCSVSGTDYNGTALGTFTYIGNDIADTEHIITLNVAQVQAWVDGNNYGLVLRRTSAGANFQFRLSDYTTDITKRPKLVIDYTVPGGVAKPILGNESAVHSAIFGGLVVR